MCLSMDELSLLCILLFFIKMGYSKRLRRDAYCKEQKKIKSTQFFNDFQIISILKSNTYKL